MIAITDANLQWNFITRNYQRATTKLASQAVAPIVGAMPQDAAESLLAAAGGNLGRLLDDQPGSSFRAVTLPIRANMQVTTAVRAYSSNNVLGRVRGSASSGESLLFLGHWDHFGTCRHPARPTGSATARSTMPAASRC